MRAPTPALRGDRELPAILEIAAEDAVVQVRLEVLVVPAEPAADDLVTIRTGRATEELRTLLVVGHGDRHQVDQVVALGVEVTVVGARPEGVLAPLAPVDPQTCRG